MKNQLIENKFLKFYFFISDLTLIIVFYKRMWKKIGAIGPTSNDNKSNRSRDENFHDQPFSQVTKARMS